MGRRRLWEIHDNGHVRRVSYGWSKALTFPLFYARGSIIIEFSQTK